MQVRITGTKRKRVVRPTLIEEAIVPSFTNEMTSPNASNDSNASNSTESMGEVSKERGNDELDLRAKALASMKQVIRNTNCAFLRVYLSLFFFFSPFPFRI